MGGSIESILICHFLLDLHKADRTGTTISSPAVSSLNFARGSESLDGRIGTLPAFIASMGSEISSGLHFVGPKVGKAEDAVHTDEEYSHGEGLPQVDEDEMATVSMGAATEENA